MAFFRDRRFWMTLAIVVLIASVFWSGSRYPSLNDKAAMAGIAALEDPLGFQAALPVLATDPAHIKIGKVTWNWVNTNLQGMTFGVLFAAAFMTFFTLVRQVQFSNVFGGAALGTILGAPLGVCVNCAAPIAFGMARAGARLETTLATMISSPTLNIVVLTMLFTLFPLHMALAKVGVTLAFLLIGVPLLTRYVFLRDSWVRRTSLALTEPVAEPGERGFWSRTLLRWNNAAADGDGGRWWASAIWVARQYGLNLWFIFWTTVPLMLLAGLLGAVIVTFMPWEMIKGLANDSSSVLGFLKAGVIAMIGILLPVPIGFDVTMAGALQAAGWPEKIVMVLLFTMGIFSIYSFMIVWRAVSFRVAGTLMVTLAALGLMTGYGVRAYDKLWLEQFRLAPLQHYAAVDDKAPFLMPDAGADRATVPAKPPEITWDRVAVPGQEDVLLERATMVAGAPQNAEKLFTRQSVAALGIEGDYQFSTSTNIIEYLFEQSLSAADLHRDGWPDLVFVRGGRLQLYVNTAKGFARQPVALADLSDQRLVFARVADMDGDTWPDIVVVARDRGVFLLRNNAGKFDQTPQLLPGPSEFVSGLVLPADFDGDGDMDVLVAPRFVGMNAIGWRNAPEHARPMIIWQDDGVFRAGEPFGFAGVKLAILFTDLNGDGRRDLFMSNDYIEPDQVFLARSAPNGDGARFESLYRPLRKSDGLFDKTTYFTMSLVRGDVDNDQVPDLYMSNIAMGTHADLDGAARRPFQQGCASLPAPDMATRCRTDVAVGTVVDSTLRTRDYRSCDLADAGERRACLAQAIRYRAILARQPETGTGDPCGLLQGADAQLLALCQRINAMPKRDTVPANKSFLHQELNRNLMYSGLASGGFKHRARKQGTDTPGWTWNAEFADLDNNGWQDLYAVTGWPFDPQWDANAFFRNEGGKLVSDAENTGLDDYFPTMNHVTLDMDQDGDLDVVTHGMYGVVRVYRNNTDERRNSIRFVLRNATGGDVSGTRVSLTTSSGDQSRELTAGTGYKSQSVPMLHFGMGTDETATNVRIRWPDGSETPIEQRLDAGYIYRITR